MANETEEFIEKKEEQLLKEKEIKSFRNETIIGKLWYIKQNITVEPLLAGLIIPSIISRFAMANFSLDKACKVSLEFPQEICETLKRKDSTYYSSYEKEVQKLIASIDIWRGIIHTALPSIIIMFLGAWSDRTGKRKLCIILPLFGELVTSINNIINVYFFYEIPVQATVFLETFITGISGSWVTMFLGVFSYISDITSEESRSFRVGLVNLCFTAGYPIGIGVSGILLQKIGYYGIFTITSTAFTLALFYGCYCLKEPDDFLRKKGLNTIVRPESPRISFFDTTHLTDTILVAFRKRSSNHQTIVLLTLLLVFIVYGPIMSEHIIVYLFVRNRLNWNMVKFSVYSSYTIILHSLGSIFSVTVLSRKFQIDDSLLCLLAVSSKFLGSIWTALVQSDIEMYMIPITEIFNTTTFTFLRSILTKVVEKQEIAKVNSLFSLTETVAALIFNPFYSWLYMKTLQLLSGAVFLFSAVMIIPAACILISFFILNRARSRNAKKNALEAEAPFEKQQETKEMTTSPSFGDLD